MNRRTWGQRNRHSLNALSNGQSVPAISVLVWTQRNALLVLPDNPIPKLFNMSYSSSVLPPSWKSALIVPISKSDGTFHSISLTGCQCKLMERVILRLIYNVGDSMSPNLHGFMKGRSTDKCFIKCLSNVPVTCRSLIDLKGAFDWSNKNVVIEELIVRAERWEKETFKVDEELFIRQAD